MVFDISGIINLSSPLVITNSYLTIAGQTAPGGGITVAGNMTAVTNAHDVIIRDVRFRPVTDPTVVWHNGFEGYPTTIGDMAPPTYNYVDGWQIDSGSIDLYNATQSGYNAYQGSEWVDLNGDGPARFPPTFRRSPASNMCSVLFVRPQSGDLSIVWPFSPGGDLDQ